MHDNKSVNEALSHPGAPPSAPKLYNETLKSSQNGSIGPTSLLSLSNSTSSTTSNIKSANLEINNNNQEKINNKFTS